MSPHLKGKVVRLRHTLTNLFWSALQFDSLTQRQAERFASRARLRKMQQQGLIKYCPQTNRWYNNLPLKENP